MREKSEAQKFLEGFELADAQTECKLAERQYWADKSLKITGQMGGERVQASGSQDPMAQARDICMDMEQDILSQIVILAAKQKEVTQTLDRLDNPTEYKVLHQRYIQFKDYQTIADNFNSDYTWATTVHGRALKSVEKILNIESNPDEGCT